MDAIYLRVIKTAHTIVWAILVACICAIPVVGWFEKYDQALWLSGIVLVEVLVLTLNRWRCPLAGLAARFTDDRRANFDIYLPAWLSRNNKLIFGILFVAGEAIVALRWFGWIG